MKIRISNYTFNASTNQITFGDYTQISLDGILLVINVTSNIIIYNFANPATGGTVSGNVLTLDYNTSSMSSSDKLLIYYDDSNIPATNATIQLLQNQNDLLRRAVKLLESGGTVDSGSRQRVVVEAIPTVTTTLASTAVASNLTAQIGNSYPDNVNPYTLTSKAALLVTEYPIGQEWRVVDNAMNTFAQVIRSNIK